MVRQMSEGTQMSERAQGPRPLDLTTGILATTGVLLIGMTAVLLYDGRPVWGMLSATTALGLACVVLIRRRPPGARQAENARAVAGILMVGALFVVGWLVLAMYAGSLVNKAAAMSVGFFVSLASIAAGGLLGFIFGIPRSVAAADATPSLGTAGSPGSTYRANTNLEQISDWLTKILVGVGLIQLGSIGDSLSGLIREVASGLNPAGPTKSDVSVAAALLVVYTVLGFVGGYVVSRTMLMRLFRKAEQLDLQAQLVAADVAVTDWLQDGSITEDQVSSAVAAVPPWFQSVLLARIKLITRSKNASTADRAVRLDKLLTTPRS